MTFHLAQLVQWLHVLAGIVWVGGQVVFTVILTPVLLQMPAPDRRWFMEQLGHRAGPIMGLSGQLVLVLGILRGTWLGPIRSWGALVQTGYGRTFLVALLLTIAAMGHSGAVRLRAQRLAADEQGITDADARRLGRQHAVTLVLLAAVVACMVRMRFGG